MAFDPDAYLAGGAATGFDPDAYLAADVPTLEPQVVSPEAPPELPLAERIKQGAKWWLTSPEAAQRVRTAIQANVDPFIEHPLESAYKMVVPQKEDIESIAALAKPETYQQNLEPGSQEWLNQVVGYGAAAIPGIPLLKDLKVPFRPGIEPPVPPVEAPAAPPPVTVAEAIKAIPPETTVADAIRVAREVPPETPIQAIPELLSRPPETPPVEVPVEHGEFAKPGYTAVETPPAPEAAPPPPTAEVPEPYTPEAAAARAAEAEPSGAGPSVEIPPEDVRYAGGEPPVTPEAPPIHGPSEPVGGNVAGFEKVYGPGEIEAGGTISPEDAWDAASARAQSGKAQPYNFVDRARTGAITPEEMGDLIYEHHRLVERAAGLEGMPDYAGASQAAKDFASNVLKPAETAWHQKGMVMQIERPVNLNTFTGMDQLMQTELNRGIKPSEAPKFTRMAEDVKNGESEVAKAVERSDARVRTKYAKVRDIPIEEAVARVKQMLKDCM